MGTKVYKPGSLESLGTCTSLSTRIVGASVDGGELDWVLVRDISTPTMGIPFNARHARLVRGVEVRAYIPIQMGGRCRQHWSPLDTGQWHSLASIIIAHIHHVSSRLLPRRYRYRPTAEDHRSHQLRCVAFTRPKRGKRATVSFSAAPKFCMEEKMVVRSPSHRFTNS